MVSLSFLCIRQNIKFALAQTAGIKGGKIEGRRAIQVTGERSKRKAEKTQVHNIKSRQINKENHRTTSHFLFGVSAKHLSDEVSTTVSQNATTGSATLISENQIKRH